MSEDILLHIIISFLGFTGFSVARHIYTEKKSERPLVCPVNFDCQGVVHSNFSRFLNIPIEIIGMLYYVCVCVGYLFLAFDPQIIPFQVKGGILLASFIAFLFSIYLTIVQSFVLKKFCSWCLVSAILCVFIFSFTFALYDLSGVFGFYF